MVKIYVGIDDHKKFSQVCVMNETDQILWEGQTSSTREEFIAIRSAFPSDASVSSVLEAGRNWGKLFDLLEDLKFNPCLANPLKLRMIADSFIKTDKIDARALAKCLRAGMIPLVHVPPKEIRNQKNVLRQRQWLVREQTRIKNRIHCVLDRNHLGIPALSDLFGTQGRAWMNALELPDPDGKLLASDLNILDEIRSHIRQTERWVDEIFKDHPLFSILTSLPGVGNILGALMALEIHTPDRFPTAPRFMSYSGLAVSTYSSGGKTFHGHLIPACNRHLRYAFIEAAWTASKVSPYFSAYYKRLRRRLSAHHAIIQTARKLCQITFSCIAQARPYQEKPYRFWPSRLEVTLA